MTDFLAKPLETFSSRQGDQVVGDHGKRPVCLNALPGAHKHLAKCQMLLDLLVKGLDPEPLLVQSYGPSLAHDQIVGDQESGFGAGALGDEQRHHPDFGKENDQLGNLEPLLPGGTNGLVLSRSLGQVADDLFDTVDLHVTVPFDSRNENPSRCRDKIENRSTGVPAVHKRDKGSADPFAERCQDCFCQIDLALKSSLGTQCLGTISANVPAEPLAMNSDNASHGALTPDKPIAGVMDSDPFDRGTLSLGSCVVDNDKSFPPRTGGQPVLTGYGDMLNVSSSGVEKPLKIVGSGFEVTLGNLPRGVELDQADQPDKIPQEVFPLRFAQKSQENRKIGRNFFGRSFAYGFHAVLLALVGIGDFGWKPFYLKQLSSFVT